MSYWLCFRINTFNVSIMQCDALGCVLMGCQESTDSTGSLIMILQTQITKILSGKYYWCYTQTAVCKHDGFLIAITSSITPLYLAQSASCSVRGLREMRLRHVFECSKLLKGPISPRDKFISGNLQRQTRDIFSKYLKTSRQLSLKSFSIEHIKSRTGERSNPSWWPCG